MLLLSSLSTLHAQVSQQPTLKGHHTGETIEQFMATSPALRARLSASIQHPQPAARDDSAIEDIFMQSGIVNSPCSEILKLTNPRADVLIRQGMVEDVISGLAQLFGKKQEDMPEENLRNLEFYGSVQFMNGRVTLLELHLPGNWEESEDDLYSKFGRPTKVSSTAMHNQYGATDRIADVYWERASYVAHAYETIDGNMKRTATVELMTPATYQQWQKLKNSRKNSLD